MSTTHPVWLNRTAPRWILILTILFGRLACAFADDDLSHLEAVTNVFQVRSLASQNPIVAYHILLEGNVLWANTSGRIVLQDSSGAAELELNLAGQRIAAGTRVRLTMNGTITQRGAGLQLGVRGPVVDNDGIHAAVEKSGAVYLRAGRHPIRVEWFNGVEKSELEVTVEAPGLPRQKIPDAMLFSAVTDKDGTTNWVNAVAYRCCDVLGETLPDFDQAIIIKNGRVSNFDLSVAAHLEHVGLQFLAWFDAPRDGLYTFATKSDDGSRLFIEEPPVNLETLGAVGFPEPQRIAIGQTLTATKDREWVKAEGKVAFVREQSNGLQMDLSTGAGRLRVEVANASPSSQDLLNRRVAVVGFCESAFTSDGEKIPGVLLVPDEFHFQLLEDAHGQTALTDTNAATLPVLTTAVEVHHLKREEAQRGYPVRIHGVVTCVLPEHQSFTLEDSTRGLYIEDLSQSRSVPPRLGEYLEVEGYTDPRFFAPMVNARRVVSLGTGQLPEPVHPSWEQLINGSLDAQYIEIQGIITSIDTNGVAAFLTQGGLIKAELRVNGLNTAELRHYTDALVRLRGVLFASWDYVTHEVKVGETRIYGADIMVEQPVPDDLFASPSKTVAELSLFDPQAGTFQRVKVSGQIVYTRGMEYFLMQGGNGLRFTTKTPVELRPGDRVEVVGFPELLGNASPVLREAVVRKTGHADLPAPRRLTPEDMNHAEHDATRVRIEGLLVNVKTTPASLDLEMQNGVRSFLARLDARQKSMQAPAIGSRLDLTGIYAAQGGNRTAGPGIGSFELLLGSPADIKVLARPPWWTLERLLIMVGILACVLIATMLWVTQLHRKVEERTQQLGTQIRERELAEQQRAMERERARVAQDLHDELGSGLTEIGMLVNVAKSASVAENNAARHLEQIGERAGEMVTALDEIVWAMNPKHDSLASLVSYSCLYADRFLRLANIGCRLKGAVDVPDRIVSSTYRHEFFLAFKEALTNVVRHSGATEVRLGVRLIGASLRLSIADNGGGLAANITKEGSDGLLNMRARLKKMGGRFEIASIRGRGTTLRFYMPLD